MYFQTNKGFTMAGCFIFLLLLLLSLTEDSRGQTPSPVVTTSLGQVVGSRKQDASGNVYDEFLGMPFGAPPIGPLRWQPPQAPSAWEGVRNATQFSPHCIHTLAASYPESDGMSNATSEDCLYLNVWVPGGVQEGSGGGPGRTFAYNYRYRHSFQMYPSWVNGSHSDDLFSWHGTVFRPKFRQEQLGEYNADDLRMRDNLHTVCHNHAYNGSPGTGRPLPFTWPEYNQETRQFARLSAFMTPASLESETADMVSRYQFWIDLMAVTDPIPQKEYMEPLGNFDSYTEEDLIAACDRLLPMIVPGYGQYRDSLVDTLTDAFYRARERRVINLTKWGIRRRI